MSPAKRATKKPAARRAPVEVHAPVLDLRERVAAKNAREAAGPARAVPVAVAAAIGIFSMTREWTTYGWLCASCVKLREARGWTLAHVCWSHYACPGGHGDVPCQDCAYRAQLAGQ